MNQSFSKELVVTQEKRNKQFHNDSNPFSKTFSVQIGDVDDELWFD